MFLSHANFTALRSFHHLFNYFPIDVLITLYTLTSVYIFSILFSNEYISYGSEEENLFSNLASLVGDHFLYSHDLNV